MTARDDPARQPTVTDPAEQMQRLAITREITRRAMAVKEVAELKQQRNSMTPARSRSRLTRARSVADELLHAHESANTAIDEVYLFGTNTGPLLTPQH